MMWNFIAEDTKSSSLSFFKKKIKHNLFKIIDICTLLLLDIHTVLQCNAKFISNLVLF